jgi:hypothetical protein
LKLAAVDYLVLAVYFGFVLGIGWRLRKKMATSEDFLTSGHSVPVWITSLAFLAANLGAQELVGMSGSGAKYGIMTAHFYWVGAVPGDDLRWPLHDAVLLGQPRAQRSRVSEDALRRKDARLERRLVRGDDGVLVRHLDVRAGSAAAADPRLEFHHDCTALRGHRPGVHIPWGADQRNLQRSAAIFPHRDGLLTPGNHGGDEGGRLERNGGPAANYDAAPAESTAT